MVFLVELAHLPRPCALDIEAWVIKPNHKLREIIPHPLLLFTFLCFWRSIETYQLIAPRYFMKVLFLLQSNTPVQSYCGATTIKLSLYGDFCL